MSPVVVAGVKALNAADAVVCPVPPFAMLKVLMVIANVPDVVTGLPEIVINPFDDERSTDVTVPLVAGTSHEGVDPLDVKIRPAAPIANRDAVLTPVPIMRSPMVVVGERALKAELASVCPVPPFAIPSVPMVIANVPDDVTGVPLTAIKASEEERPTEVTVPLVAGAAQEAVIPSEVKTSPLDPIGNAM
jgi:hypothetical protein